MFREFDDNEHKQLVNEYRFKRPEYAPYRQWTPNISKKEHNIKKRIRENHYIKYLKEEIKPVLLIQEKHVHQSLRKAPVYLDKTELNKFYKCQNET